MVSRCELSVETRDGEPMGSVSPWRSKNVDSLERALNPFGPFRTRVFSPHVHFYKELICALIHGIVVSPMATFEHGRKFIRWSAIGRMPLNMQSCISSLAF